MASETVGILRVLLTANSAEFEAAMKKAADTAKVWSKDLAQIGRQAQDVGMALTKTLTLPIVALAGSSIKAASDFESSFAGIIKTVDDATDSLGNLTPVGAALAQGMRDLALTIPINVNELNRIGEAAGQLGIESRHILGFTRVMADLGATTNLSSDEAATALARLANITQMPQDQFDRLGSTIVDLGNNFATTEAEIVEFGTRIAGAGKLAGLSEHQILAIGTAMSSVGVQAEAGGTSVQKVLNAMTESVANGGPKLEKFAATAGMTAQQFADAYRKDAAGAFSAFVSGLGTQGDQAFTTLSELGLSNERVIRAFLSLANAGDLLTETLRVGAKGWEENTALTKEAEQRYKTFASQLAIFWAQVREVGIELGTSLLPVLRDVLTAAQPLIKATSDLANWFAALPDPARLAGVGFAGALAAIGPLTWAFGQAISSIGILIGAFGKKGIAMRALIPIYGATATAAKAAWASMLGPVALIGGAIVAIGALGAKLREVAGVSEQTGQRLSRMNFVYGKSFDEMAAKANTGLPKVARAFDAMTNTATSGLDETTDALLNMSGAIVPLANDMSGVWGDAVVTAATATHEFNGAVATASKAQETFRLAIRATAPDLVAFKSGIDDAGMALQNIAAGYAASGPVIVRTFEESALASQKAREQMEEWIRKGGVLAPVMRDVRTDIDGAADATRGWAGSIKDNLSGVLDDLPSLLSRAFEGGGGLIGAMKSVGVKLANALVAPLMGPDGALSKVQKAAVSVGASLSAAIGGKAGGGTIGTIAGIASGLGGAAIAATGWGAAMAGAGVAGTVALGAATLGIGAAAVGVALLAKKFMGVSKEIKQARKDIDEFQSALHETATAQQVTEANGRSWALTLITVRDAFLKVGRSAAEAEILVAQMLNTDRPEAARAALLEINKVMANQQIEAQLLDDAIKEYGFSVEELGPKFAKQKLSEQAQRLVEHYAVLIESGIEQGVVTEKMADKTNEFLAIALRTNAEIPRSMEPMLQKMLEQGLLLDENGEKLTDLGRITWAETMTQGFDRVVGAVERLIATLGGIPRNITTVVDVEYNDPGLPERSSDEGFAGGTMGRFGKWIADFGSGFPTVLHGSEVVATTSQLPALFADMLSSGMAAMSPALAGGGSLSSTASMSTAGIESRLDRLERTLTSTILSGVELAARHGAQTAGRRR